MGHPLLVCAAGRYVALWHAQNRKQMQAYIVFEFALLAIGIKTKWGELVCVTSTTMCNVIRNKLGKRF